MKSVIRFLSSVKLVIFLLITIALVSLVGTLIPQLRSAEEYAARYGQLSGILQRLQLTKLYHSSWYIALLLLFALNIIVCTLTRLSPKIRRATRPHLETDAKALLALQNKEKFKKSSSLAGTREALRRLLRSRHYRLREKEQESRIFILARKRILGGFGSDVVHIGLLIILAGGVSSGLGGFKQDLALREGEVIRVPKAHFSLRLDKFETELYPSGAVKDWKSTVTVLDAGKAVQTKIVEVNHPLPYRGFNFYQSSYGWDWENPSLELWVKKKDDPASLEKLILKPGARAGLGDGQTQVSIRQFLPDFVLDENKRPTTRSLEPNNPAALVDAWRGEENIFSGWIFANFPDFAQAHSQKDTDVQFELRDFKAGQYSVLQAARDPGVNLIWVGCAVLMAGILLAFYWPTREIRLILEKSDRGTEIVAGGISAKSREAFQSEFQKIMSSARRSE
jgi:cytochrome c biogenesis protein